MTTGSSGEALMHLENIQRLSPLVTRVLGQNPGPYTLQGTNTYLLGHRKAKRIVLLDTGQDIPEYTPLLREALSEYSGSVHDIVLSHYHPDHILGLRSVLPLLKELGQAPPRIHKCMNTKQSDLDKPLFKLLEDLRGAFRPAPSGSDIHVLEDNQTISIEDESKRHTVRVLKTPGHTEDSACFVLNTEESKPVLFTADTVLGQGTAVFTDLRALLQSLERCIAEVGENEDGVKLFCGHGPVVENGVAQMREYIAHRLQREQQIIKALQDAGEALSAAELVKRIYGPDLPAKLVLAAEHGIVLHLEKLEQDGKVERVPQPDGSTRWKLCRGSVSLSRLRPASPRSGDT